MRYGDIQDTRKLEVLKEQRREELHRSFMLCLERLSSKYDIRKMIVIFGATFII